MSHWKMSQAHCDDVVFGCYNEVLLRLQQVFTEVKRGYVSGL